MGKWLSLAVYVIRMVWKYGPRLWKIGRELYDEIEARCSPDGTPLDATEKAVVFNEVAQKAIAEHKGYVPRRPVVNLYRERVWRYRNPGKTPKRLTDARLRYGTKVLRKGK